MGRLHDLDGHPEPDRSRRVGRHQHRAPREPRPLLRDQSCRRAVPEPQGALPALRLRRVLAVRPARRDRARRTGWAPTWTRNTQLRHPRSSCAPTCTGTTTSRRSSTPSAPSCRRAATRSSAFSPGTIGEGHAILAYDEESVPGGTDIYVYDNNRQFNPAAERDPSVHKAAGDRGQRCSRHGQRPQVVVRHRRRHLVGRRRRQPVRDAAVGHPGRPVATRPDRARPGDQLGVRLCAGSREDDGRLSRRAVPAGARQPWAAGSRRHMAVEEAERSARGDLRGREGRHLLPGGGDPGGRRRGHGRENRPRRARQGQRQRHGPARVRGPELRQRDGAAAEHAASQSRAGGQGERREELRRRRRPGARRSPRTRRRTGPRTRR